MFFNTTFNATTTICNYSRPNSRTNSIKLSNVPSRRYNFRWIDLIAASSGLSVRSPLLSRFFFAFFLFYIQFPAVWICTWRNLCKWINSNELLHLTISDSPMANLKFSDRFHNNNVHWFLSKWIVKSLNFQSCRLVRGILASIPFICELCNRQRFLFGFRRHKTCCNKPQLNKSAGNSVSGTRSNSLWSKTSL